jgi:hypothetical protein
MAFVTVFVFVFLYPTFLHLDILYFMSMVEACRGAVGWSAMLQAGRLRVRFSVGSLGFFHWLNPSGHTMVLTSTPTLTERSTRVISRESKGGRCVNLTTLPPSCHDFIEILGILESSGRVQVFTGINWPLHAQLVFCYVHCCVFVTSLH